MHPQKKGREQAGERKEDSEKERSRTTDYFCVICFRAFKSIELLEEHKKTHRELEVTKDACRMLAQPAGVV